MSFQRTAGIGAMGALVLASGMALGAGSLLTVEYDVTDGRRYTGDGDWDQGNLKAECSPGLERLVGLSGPPDNATGTNGELGRIAGCELTAIGSSSASHTTHSLRSGHDDRADTGTGDWDVNYLKAECGPAEIMGGISQTSSRLVSKILCRPIVCDGQVAHLTFTIDEGACNTVMFNTRDNRLSTYGGDWSPGYMKNQCGDNQILKGVSANPDGTVHALLCCNSISSSC